MGINTLVGKLTADGPISVIRAFIPGSRPGLMMGGKLTCGELPHLRRFTNGLSRKSPLNALEHHGSFIQVPVDVPRPARHSALCLACQRCTSLRDRPAGQPAYSRVQSKRSGQITSMMISDVMDQRCFLLWEVIQRFRY